MYLALYSLSRPSDPCLSLPWLCLIPWLWTQMSWRPFMGTQAWYWITQREGALISPLGLPCVAPHAGWHTVTAWPQEGNWTILFHVSSLSNGNDIVLTSRHIVGKHWPLNMQSQDKLIGHWLVHSRVFLVASGHWPCVKHDVHSLICAKWKVTTAVCFFVQYIFI